MTRLRNRPQLQHFQQGLSQAYERYRLELRAFFRRNAPQTHIVDDLMQTMFLQVTKERQGEAVRDPRLYLFRAAWNVLHNANQKTYREGARTVSCDLPGFDDHAERSNLLWVEDDTSTATQQEELNQVLAQLPRVCQIALLRQYRDGRSYREIAAELGVSVHAVKKYTVRALNHFRMHFNMPAPSAGKIGKRS